MILAPIDHETLLFVDLGCFRVRPPAFRECTIEHMVRSGNFNGPMRYDALGFAIGDKFNRRFIISR